MEERDNITPFGNEPAENAQSASVQNSANAGITDINEPLKQTRTVISSEPVNNTAYSSQSTAYNSYSSQNMAAQSAPSAVNHAADNTAVQNSSSVNNTAYGSQDTVKQYSNDTNTVHGSTQQTTPPPSQNVRKPVYDKFMYEPIGFAGYDTRAHIPPENPYGTIAEMYNSGEDEEPAKESVIQQPHEDEILQVFEKQNADNAEASNGTKPEAADASEDKNDNEQV